MRLLSATQTREAREEERVRDILRTKEIQDAADRARKNLANAEADFNTTLARNREKWALEEQEHASRILEMEKEVAELELRKKAALESISDLERQAEERVDSLSEQLQDKLDEVGAQKQDLDKLAQQLQIKKEGLEQQVAQIISYGKLKSPLKTTE